MLRWYIGFQCAGKNPETLINQIEGLIRRHDLGRYVPVLRCEKRGKKSGFYLFLGIESEKKDLIPEAVRVHLLWYPGLSHQVGTFTLDEIRSMVGAEHDVHTYTRQIPYLRSYPVTGQNPFDDVDNSNPLSHGYSNESTRRYDYLLYWLSATGSASWQVFQNAWQLLRGPSNEGSQRVLRHFRLLGHLETSPDRQRWSTTPTVLTTISQGKAAGQVVICGQRVLGLVRALQECGTLEQQPQAQRDGPTTIRLQAADPEQILNVLQQKGYAARYQPTVAERLAQQLPTLEAWKNTLEALPGIRPYTFTIRQFDGVSWREVEFEDKSGFYELGPQEGSRNTATKSEYKLFYDAATNRWLRADWYGLRFLTRYSAGQACPVYYNTALAELAVPTEWHWPEIYERALVLSSGRLPRHQDDWLIYESISTTLLDELCDKMRLNVEELDNA